MDLELRTIPGTDKKDKAEVLLRGSPPGKEMQATGQTVLWRSLCMRHSFLMFTHV